MADLKPAAMFDLLYLTNEMNTFRDDSVSLAEIQAAAYVACLMSVFRGRPSASWGYPFFTNSTAAAFSPDLLNAQGRGVSSGVVRSDPSRLQLTTEGERRLASLTSMSTLAWRIEFLQGACEAVKALPVASLSAAVSMDPQLALSSLLGIPQRLLDEIGVATIREDFAVLHRQFGPNVDIIVPAIVWLSFLLANSATEVDE